MLKKYLLLFCILCFLFVGGSAFLVEGSNVNPLFKIWYMEKNDVSGVNTLKTRSFSTLQEAYAGAASGETIGLDWPVGVDIGAPLTIDKDVVLSSEFCPAFYKYPSKYYEIRYTGTSKSFLTVASGAKLTLRSIILTGNTNSTLKKGGLLYVKSGGTAELLLDGKIDKYQYVTFQNSKLKASGSCGGAIYVESGGRLILNGVTFSGNSAKNGNDVYCESGAAVLSDLNGDAVIDVRDLIRQKKNAADSAVLATGFPDANFDGKTDANDILLFKRLFLSFK